MINVFFLVDSELEPETELAHPTRSVNTDAMTKIKVAIVSYVNKPPSS